MSFLSFPSSLIISPTPMFIEHTNIYTTDYQQYRECPVDRTDMYMYQQYDNSTCVESEEPYTSRARKALCNSIFPDRHDQIIEESITHLDKLKKILREFCDKNTHIPTIGELGEYGENWIFTKWDVAKSKGSEAAENINGLLKQATGDYIFNYEQYKDKQENEGIETFKNQFKKEISGVYHDIDLQKTPPAYNKDLFSKTSPTDYKKAYKRDMHIVDGLIHNLDSFIENSKPTFDALKEEQIKLETNSLENEEIESLYNCHKNILEYLSELKIQKEAKTLERNNIEEKLKNIEEEKANKLNKISKGEEKRTRDNEMPYNIFNNFERFS